MDNIAANNYTTATNLNAEDIKTNATAPYDEAEFTAQMLAWLRATVDNYVNPANSALIKLVGFTKDVVGLQQAIAKMMQAGTDSEHMQVDINGILGQIDALKTQYAYPADVLMTTSTEEAAIKWAKDLGLDERTAVKPVTNADGTVSYIVRLDLGPLTDLRQLYSGMYPPLRALTLPESLQRGALGDKWVDPRPAEQASQKTPFQVNIDTVNAKKAGADPIFQRVSDESSTVGVKVTGINEDGKNRVEIMQTYLRDLMTLINALYRT